MKKAIRLAGVCAAIFSLQILAGDSVQNFTLNDVDGNSHSLYDYKDSKAIVLMFIATRCPVSNAYNERMVELHNAYKEKGVTFIGINSNKTEPVDEVKKHAGEKGFAFVILKDNDNVIADRLDAKVTPEIFVLSPNLEIVYHGRIDDSQNQENIKTRDLQRALDQYLNNENIAVAHTKAFGCTIKKVTS